MTINEDDLTRFYQFATGKISEGVDSIYDLVDAWEAESLTDEQLQHNAQEIQKAVDDMDSGDTGKPAREIIDGLRNRTV